MLDAIPFAEVPLVEADNSRSLGRLQTVDLDNDGDNDVVTYDGATIYWLRRDATGLSLPQPIAQVSGGIQRLQFVELDGDGDLDLLVHPFQFQNWVVPRRVHEIWWFENIFAGDERSVFDDGASLQIPVDYTPSATVAADLDRNGAAEIWIGATSNGGENSLFRFDNSGLDFELTYQFALDGRGHVSLLGAHDIDGDGSLDLIVDRGHRYDFYTVWYEANGEMLRAQPNTLRDSRTGLRYTQFVFVDVDGDGDEDLVAAANQLTDLWNTYGSIRLLEKVDQRTFAAPRTIPYSSFIMVLNGPIHQLEVGDFDGDGDIDLVGSVGECSPSCLLFSVENRDGKGDFIQSPMFHNYSGVGVTVLDGIAPSDPAHVVYSKSNGLYQFPGIELSTELSNERTVSTVVRPLPTHVHAVEWDGDQRMDLVYYYEETAEYQIWRNTDGLGTFELASSFRQGNSSTRTWVFDVNADGLEDIVTRDDRNSAWQRSFDLRVILSPGNFTDTPSVVELGTMPQNWLTPTDLDQDGDLDLVASSPGIATYQNVDGRFVPWQAISQSAPFFSVGDVDGDGDDDLLELSTDALLVWRENVDGRFEPPVVVRIDEEVEIIGPNAMADLDRDGDLDAIYSFRDRNRPGASDGWLENLGIQQDGSPSFAKHELSGIRLGNRVGDFDRDGDLDIELASESSPFLAWLENIDLRSNAWTVHEVDSIRSGYFWHDVDGDGDIDATANTRQRWSWYRNDTPPIRSGDFDGDFRRFANDLDILFAAIRSDSSDSRFDLNADDRVDFLDARFWIFEIAQTTRGDANLDGVFDSADLVLVFEAGEYEDDLVGNSGWATGDWNGDGEFNSTDLVIALQG